MSQFARVLLAIAAVGSATVILSDPANYADLAADATDNTIKADYVNGGPMYLAIPITGPYYYNDTDITLAHKTLTEDKNDTSVIVVTQDSTASISYSDVVKEGYSTSLNQASFFGLNAAINVANASTAHLHHLNVTTHNGAANIYAYGDGTTVYVDNSDLYSSGPAAHGAYAAGNATIVVRDVRQYSGGIRSSAFAGDTPAGFVYVYDSETHTAGIGSASFYALGSVYGENVVGYSEKAPSLFMDGDQSANFTNVDLTAGFLAGTVMFSSMIRESGGILNFTNSRLTTLGDTMPGLWFGNIIASANLVSTEINTTSGILVIANCSQVTQEFDYFAGFADNSDLLPAEVTISVKESTLSGDLVAYNGSAISWSLSEYSSWAGSAYSGYGSASFAVSLDSTSSWTLTNDTVLQDFTSANGSVSNVHSAGYNVYYNSTSTANQWIKGRSVKLPGGGYLKPS